MKAVTTSGKSWVRSVAGAVSRTRYVVVMINNKFMKNLIVWDLETSGFVEDPLARILEIGAMVIRDGEIVSRHSWLLNHGIEIPAKITEITGITKELIDAEGKDPYTSLKEFTALFIPNQSNLTHNGIRFDLPFLEKELLHFTGNDPEKKFDVKKMILHLSNAALDTAAEYKGRKLKMVQSDEEDFLDYARRVLDTRVYGLKYSIATCCDDLKIDRTNITQHRALGDVELTYKIYQKLHDSNT